ncbi:MAG: HAD-IA family hydrolase [Gammaproteobacteria bacterium]|nr:HAD-IA family hydrolase [Gammaproteobacteria bacterium]
MRLNAPMLVVFDWDGTLIDSVGRIVASLQAAAVDCGLEVPDGAACRGVIGLSLPVALDTLFGQQSGGAREQLLDAYRHHYLHASEVAERPFIGLQPLLKALAEQGHKLAVATGKSRLGLDRSLHDYRLGHHFQATRCADESHSKPHPQMLHELMDTIGHGPQHTVMVGDSRHDMAMAVAAGVQAIGISHGVDDDATLRAAGANQVVADLPALAELLGVYCPA